MIGFGTLGGILEHLRCICMMTFPSIEVWHLPNCLVYAPHHMPLSCLRISQEGVQPGTVRTCV
jgi:hypothetical protein